MKKILAILLITVFLAGCTADTPNNNGSTAEDYITGEYQDTAEKGVWISFSEINSMLKSEDGFKSAFSAAVSDCTELGINEIYIHVRAYCDSLYPSDLFPIIDEAKEFDYDAFAYALELCHSVGIKVHAWINPYRVLSSSEDIEKAGPESPAYKWLNDDNPDNDLNVIKYNGIYLNPAQDEVRELIINGVKEIADKYAIDGLHLDDYFYPTADPEFDRVSYEKYCAAAEKPLTLSEWRRSNVNMMISGCYNAVKYVNKNIEFSVSPMASVDKNYNELYADVTEWIKCGYIDYIIPQLYFGYDYPDDDFKFENLLKEWIKLSKINGSVGLKIGLAPYKINPTSEADKAEWENGTDIIARQAEECKKNGNVKGYVLFSYSSLFSDESVNTIQRENLKKVISD